MQQPAQMLPVIPNYPPTNITTEQIQKYLDENKKLILAILDNQNLGKLAECAQYQAQLQKNLMYLAAIADSQPQTATMPGQIVSHPDMQQPGGGFYMQHPQAAAAAMAQQAGLFSQKMPLQFNNSPQHQQYLQQHHQQAAMMMQGQLGIRPNVGMANNGMQQHSSSHAAEVGGGSSKQDGSDGNGGGGGGGGDGDSSFKKGSEDK